jgi:RHS repeat-associated protein
VTNADGSTISYTYDANGNTLTKTDSTGTTKYEYNSNNQLTKVTKPNGDIITYAYNGDNQRISKTINGVITNYIYDGNVVSKEMDASGKVLASYVYDDKGSPVSVTNGGKTYNYQYNGHGDVVALTDSNGNVVSTYAYDVWGNVTTKTGNIDSIYGYAGQFGYVYDQETGYYFLQSRYYDPGIGRFTTKDRFKGFEDRPASQNPYTYCENNPVMQIDPNGYATICIVIRVGSILQNIINYGTVAFVYVISGVSVLLVARNYGYSRYNDRGNMYLTVWTTVAGGVFGAWVSSKIKNIVIPLWIPFARARTYTIG